MVKENGIDLDRYADFSRCPACGDWSDYCQGHGSSDIRATEIFEKHDDGDHSMCVIDCEGEVEK